jgi:alkanesulfonate monooxygenase SsuD/methylene tetrahydromethanopterin reductase-like flavin-dependent oxidoreductase (luciferase family)
MSGGRVELGIGAGWYDAEHSAYAIPFPPAPERFDRLDEQLAILTGLWATRDGETFDFTGVHYSVTDSPGLPKPVQQPGPPILIGGKGARRTPELTARYAAEFNLPFGRDPSTLGYSNAHTVCCGADEAELSRRAAAIGRSLDDLRTNALAGTPQEIVDTIGKYAELGTERLYLQVLDLHDLDHLDLLATEVMPHV